MVKSPRDLLPVLGGVLISLLSLALAWFSLSALNEQDYGKALILAGNALGLGVLPMSKMRRGDLSKPINELAIEAIKNPEPLPMRIAIGVAWLLFIAGIVTYFV